MASKSRIRSREPKSIKRIKKELIKVLRELREELINANTQSSAKSS